MEEARLSDLVGNGVLAGASRGQLRIAARIDAAGNVLESRGEAGEVAGLADLAAHVGQVAQLIGGELGLGRFMALQSLDGQEQIVIGAEQSGELLAVCGPRQAAWDALWRRLDL
jgi:hypothetical protein